MGRNPLDRLVLDHQRQQQNDQDRYCTSDQRPADSFILLYQGGQTGHEILLAGRLIPGQFQQQQKMLPGYPPKIKTATPPTRLMSKALLMELWFLLIPAV
jgi:hypothetical protein